MKTIATAETARGKLRYTLFSHETEGTEQFGITVTSTLFGDETATLCDISADIVFANRLMMCLADNAILPSTFKEIVEDYIAAATTV